MELLKTEGFTEYNYMLGGMFCIKSEEVKPYVHILRGWGKLTRKEREVERKWHVAGLIEQFIGIHVDKQVLGEDKKGGVFYFQHEQKKSSFFVQKM